MRGHGRLVVGSSLRDAAYMEINAEMQLKAMSMGEVTYLSAGEIEAVKTGRAGFTLERVGSIGATTSAGPMFPMRSASVKTFRAATAEGTRANPLISGPARGRKVLLAKFERCRLKRGAHGLVPAVEPAEQ